MIHALRILSMLVLALASCLNCAAAAVRSHLGADQQYTSEFLRRVDESISAKRIADDPYHFVGKRVDLHCMIRGVVDRGWFTAQCSPDLHVSLFGISHEPPHLDTDSLAAGQSIRILGVVNSPIRVVEHGGRRSALPVVSARVLLWNVSKRPKVIRRASDPIAGRNGTPEGDEGRRRLARVSDDEKSVRTIP